MIFGNKKIDLNMPIELMIDTISLERVYETTFLGVIIDHKFNWKAHIKQVRSKVAKSIGVLYKAKQILSYNSLYTLYNTLIQPYLTYCVEVWGNTYQSNIQPICTIQKKAIRIVHKVGYRDHTNTLFLRSKILKFIDLVDFKTAQIIYKARNKGLPANIQRLFMDREGNYYLRRELNLKHLGSRLNLKSMCVSVKGVSLWNHLPEEIQKCRNIIQFKIRYKQNILDKYRL